MAPMAATRDGSTSTTASAPAPVYLVSSTRRVLLKALMRALALTNFSPGTVNVKVAGLEDGTLCGALNLIFTNPRLFGAGVFSLAANLLCDVMNHEPTCYPKLDAQGVPKAFLDAWERDDPDRFRRRIRSAASRTPWALACRPAGWNGSRRPRR